MLNKSLLTGIYSKIFKGQILEIRNAYQYPEKQII